MCWSQVLVHQVLLWLNFGWGCRVGVGVTRHTDIATPSFLNDITRLWPNQLSSGGAIPLLMCKAFVFIIFSTELHRATVLCFPFYFIAPLYFIFHFTSSRRGVVTLFLGLARTVCIHRIWPYIWWFSCQKYRIYTVYIWFWPTLLIHNVCMA